MLQALRSQSVIARNIFWEALESLRGRRLQVMLSSFGIATGIAAIVLLVAIVSGMHRYAVEQFSAVGANTIRVTPSQQRSTRDPRGFPVSLRTPDLATLLASVPAYDRGMAENSGFGVIRTPRRSSQNISVRGLTEQGFEIMSLQADRGRLFIDAEYTTASRVVVLGADLATDLFVDESPIGQTVVIGDWPFQVVGVLAWVGDPGAGDANFQDRSAFLPFRTCAAVFRPNEYASAFALRLAPGADPVGAMAATRTRLDVLRQQRGESSGEYQVVSSIERMGELNLVLNAIKVVVGLVGGIGLFVGAVGVANVLLVSVRERRAEIGTRRAVGATRRAIFAGFLVEALVMTLVGGMVGIGAAWLLTKIAIFIPQVPVAARPHISPVTALTALTLLSLVGLVAGVWPAKRAAAVFPAEALRAD
jgi:putative ABC transport system permease protein